MPGIRLRAVRKRYAGAPGNAVAGLDLDIGDGEFMCLLGPSGCGKSTTLRMVAGLEHPSAGQITIGERVVDSVEAGVYVPPERRGVGLVFQSYALWPHLTVERNVDFGLRLRKLARADRARRVDEVMRALGIEDCRRRYPAQLSGGQQQRVALARMLAVNPAVLMLDEPLSNLDARLRLEMRAELKRVHREFATTVVFVTHDQWEAMTLATTIAVMNQGVLQQVGTPDQIYDRPANRFVAEFVGNPPINIIELADPPTPLAQAARAWLDRRGAGATAGSLAIRPEAARLALPGDAVPDQAFAVPAQVTAVLPTGGSWIVEVNAGGQPVFTATSVAPSVGPGQSVTVWSQPDQSHVFDRDGQRWADAATAVGPPSGAPRPPTPPKKGNP